MSPLRIKLEYSQHFLSERKKYVKNNQQRFEDYKKAITLFLANSSHPSLKIEKLKNTRGVYTVRLNRSDRIFFIWKEENIALFVDIGKHDKYRKY